MLIPLDKLIESREMKIKGVIHIGAHLAEELEAYSSAGVEDVFWVEADPDTYKKLRTKVPNTHTTRCVAVSDTTGSVVAFNRSNNGQSSSLLELGTHKRHHPDVEYVDSFDVTTITMDDLTKHYDKPYNLLCLDIQGAEMMALSGGIESLKNIDYIYSEVNTEEVYEGCGLLGDMEEFLRSNGFVLTDLRMTRWNWGDALFVRKELAPVDVQAKVWSLWA